jgi:ammonium transporter, Amt family
MLLFQHASEESYEPGDKQLFFAGCFLLFCDWIFFNSGSGQSIAQNKETNNPMGCAIMTIMSAASAVVSQPLSSLIVAAINKDDITLKYDLSSTLGCLMAGCVSVTASCNNITMASAIMIGLISSVCYQISVIVFDRL